MKENEIVDLELPVTPEAAISGPVLVQTDYLTVLTFNAMRETDRPTDWGGYYKESAGTAIIEFRGLSVTRFGYPNDEVWSKVPRTKDLSYGGYEVLNSSWLEELRQLNRVAFPDINLFAGSRHFLFLFHDSSFECLASDFELQVSEEPYENIFARIQKRVLSE